MEFDMEEWKALWINRMKFSKLDYIFLLNSNQVFETFSKYGTKVLYVMYRVSLLKMPSQAV